MAPSRTLAFAAMALLFGCAARVAAFGECEAPIEGQVRAGPGSTVAAVTAGETTRTYTCGKEGYKTETTLYDTEDVAKIADAKAVGFMAADSEDNERLLTWHAPDSPEDVVGTVVLLQESATESKNKCGVEPATLRRTIKGEDAAEGFRFVVRGGIKGEAKPDCEGKKDGEEVETKLTSTYTFYGCSNDPFEEDAKSDGPADDAESLSECAAPAEGSIRATPGSTVTAVLGADITRTFTCGSEGYTTEVSLHDIADPSIKLGTLKTDSDNNRVAEFNAPGKPDEPIGSVALLEETDVKSATTCEVFNEPTRLRQAVGGEGVLADVRYVVKSAAVGDMEGDCAGKTDGDKVKADHTAFYTFWSCVNDPFEGVAAKVEEKAGDMADMAGDMAGDMIEEEKP